jgi:hypothetical protein
MTTPIHSWSTNPSPLIEANPRSGPTFYLDAGRYFVRSAMPVELSVCLDEKANLWAPIDLDQDFSQDFDAPTDGLYRLFLPKGGKGAVNIYSTEKVSTS